MSVRSRRPRLRLTTERWMHLTGEAMLVIDPDHRIGMVNPAALRLLGYAEEDLVGQRVTTVLGEDANIPHGLTPNGPVIRESAWLTRDGRRIPVRMSVADLFDASGRREGRILLGQDLSELRRAEVARRESDQKFASIVSLAPGAITIFDVDQQLYIEVNDIAAQRSGYPSERLLQMGPWDHCLLLPWPIWPH